MREPDREPRRPGGAPDPRSYRGETRILERLFDDDRPRGVVAQNRAARDGVARDGPDFDEPRAETGERAHGSQLRIDAGSEADGTREVERTVAPPEGRRRRHVAEGLDKARAGRRARERPHRPEGRRARATRTEPLEERPKERRVRPIGHDAPFLTVIDAACSRPMPTAAAKRELAHQAMRKAT